MAGIALLAPFQASVLEYTATPVYAEEHIEIVEESLEEKATRIAEEYGVSTTTLFNLIECESNWNPKADNSKDRGLVQINRAAWPEITDEQAFDPEFSLRFASEKISEGKEYLWTCANCYSYAVTQIGKLPRMADIIPNTPYPRINDLMVFNYSGVKHIAVITKVVEEGIWVKEANYEAGKISTRLVGWNNPAFVGYFSPAET